MGIRYLNTFIKNKCKGTQSIQQINFSDLEYKKIVVDTSIYLYKFLEDDALLENMYYMISLFRYYKIIPIFVFDGKPPTEKNALLEERRKLKQQAYAELNKLKSQYETVEKCQRLEYENKLKELKKQCIFLTQDNIISIKSLMTAMGVAYYQAEGEADVTCTKMVIDKQAYACLSEDMDMFVYGCPRVLRYMSLIKKTMILYKLPDILQTLNMTFDEFKGICVLAGTDYNKQSADFHQNKPELLNVITYFNLYKSKYPNTNNNLFSFYTWLLNNTSYITNQEKYDELIKIYHMFNTSNINTPNLSISINKININNVKNILKPEGFIFV